MKLYIIEHCDYGISFPATTLKAGIRAMCRKNWLTERTEYYDGDNYDEITTLGEKFGHDFCRYIENFDVNTLCNRIIGDDFYVSCEESEEE